MSLVNQNPGDFFNGGSLYAYTNKTFYPHGPTGSLQDLDALSTYTAFAEHVGLQAGKTMHPSDLVLFPTHYLLIEGKKYFNVIIYTSDLVINPDANTIFAYIVDPLESEFSVENPMRPFDDFYIGILKNINDHYQVYINLQKAAKYIEDTINIITPIKGLTQTMYEKQANIASNSEIIYTKIPKKTLTKFASVVEDFFFTYQQVIEKSGVANVVRRIPEGTDPLPLLHYRNYIEVAFIPGFRSGYREDSFTGVITSLYYQNPDEAFRQWFQWTAFEYPSRALTNSLQVLQELGLTAPTQKTDWITSIEATNGKWNISGVHNYWDNPLTRQEMIEGFGKNKLEETTVTDRTETSANISVKFLTEFFDPMQEIGLLYSDINTTPKFTEYNQYVDVERYTGFTPSQYTNIIRQVNPFVPIKVGDTFLFNLTNLSQNTVYNFRPYIIFPATSSTGLDGYNYLLMDIETFSTDLSVPVIAPVKPGLNAVVTDITQVSAKVDVAVGSTYPGAVTEKGVLVSQVNAIPTFKDNNISTAGENNWKFKSNSLSNDYTVLLTSLTWKSKYYARPYLINYPTYNSEPVIIYGDAITFRTKPTADLPFITASGTPSTDNESIELKATCFMAWDAEEDTEMFYYIQLASAVIPDKVPTEAVYLGKKDHTISSYLVTLQKQISIVGLTSGIYRIVVYGRNTSGTAYTSLKFAVGVSGDLTTQGTLELGETSYSSPTAFVSATVEHNAYVTLSATITKLGGMFEWAKLEVFSQDRASKYYTQDLVPTVDTDTGQTRYKIYKQISAIPANSNLLAVFTVKTSYEQKEFTQAFTTPATWDLTVLYKALNPKLSKTVKSDTSDITIKVNELYNDNIEEGGKMTLCIYKAGATNGQAYSLTNYTEKKEIITTKGQKEFIFDLEFTEAFLYTFVAFYTDTDTRVYRSSYIQHTVELADVIAFTKYYIFYDANGTDYTITPTEGTPGTTVFVTSETPVRSGYVFSGWNTQPHGSGETYNSGSAYVINSSVTLYAKWTSTKITVTFSTGGGSTITPQVINSGEKCLQPQNPTRDGYIFSHWFESAGAMTVKFDFNTAITGNKTLYAYWVSETASYYINFNPNGGSLLPMQTVLYNQKAVKPENPTRAGYHFVGWFTDVNLTTAYDFSLPVTTGFTLYAKWSQAGYTVTFNNGGTIVGTQQVAAGGLVQRPAKPTRQGYYFVDWAVTQGEEFNINTQLYDFNTPVTSDLTLYACYNLFNISIIYNILRYTDANEKISEEPYIAEGLISGERVLAKYSFETPPATPILEGYVFDGWYYINSESEPFPGDSAPQILNWGVNMLPFDFSQRLTLDYGVSLFTKWRKGAVSYNITFDSGLGGTSIAPQKVILGGTVIEPAVPVREGYSFSHWYLTDPQEAFDFSTAVYTDLVITAYWIPNTAGTTKQVTFNSVGGTAVAAQEVAVGAVCKKPADPTRTNYQFAGWYTSLTFATKFDFTTKITTDTTLYAKWEIIEVTRDTFDPPADAVHGQKYYFYDRVWIFDAVDNRWRLDYNTIISQVQNTIPKEVSKVRTISQNTDALQTKVDELYQELQSLKDSNMLSVQTLLNTLKDSQSISDNLSTLTDPHIIHIKKGEYLSDVINEINAKGDATAEYPYTIYFYNHSKTMDWSKFTEKIQVPEYVNIIFVGNINWWPTVEPTAMSNNPFQENFVENNPKDKLFVGFSFNRSLEGVGMKLSGLPKDLMTVLFGGFDFTAEKAANWEAVESNPEYWGTNTFNTVLVLGSKTDNVKNNALYKKIDGVFIDITPDFSYCSLVGYNNVNAFFCSSVNEGASFNFADNSFANFIYSNNKGASFRHAKNKNTFFDFANNIEASFHEADNENATFSEANNQDATFQKANNKNVNFTDARNVGTDFTEADNSGAIFYDSDNSGAIFYKAVNKKANFSAAVLTNANLEQSDNEGANFYGSVFGTDFIAGANFKGANLTNCFELPVSIATKALFIAKCGASNVDAATLWIDGTSILS